MTNNIEKNGVDQESANFVAPSNVDAGGLGFTDKELVAECASEISRAIDNIVNFINQDKDRLEELVDEGDSAWAQIDLAAEDMVRGMKLLRNNYKREEIYSIVDEVRNAISPFKMAMQMGMVNRAIQKNDTLTTRLLGLKQKLGEIIQSSD